MFGSYQNLRWNKLVDPADTVVALCDLIINIPKDLILIAPLPVHIGRIISEWLYVVN